eukprot:1609711-Alexandrium_andersonii.AAC.1
MGPCDICDFAALDPVSPRLHWRIRNLREQLRRKHPLELQRPNSEAALGCTQVKFRALAAMLRFPLGGLRID